jgi:hypothetical protein
MIIGKIDPARECFSAYSLEGTALTIGGVTIDLTAEEGNQQAVITFGYCDGRIHRGLMGKCCEYAAEVIIPPRRYQTVETEGAAGMFFGEDDEGGEDGMTVTRTETVPVPLDTDSVILRLWPFAAEEGETNAE